MDIIVLDIFAPYGHFRMPYTTTSPLTYPIPPKTAVAGMVSAIIGLDKNSYLDYFQDESFLLGIEILNPVKMKHINENFINVKVVTAKNYFARMQAGKSNRTQINVEFLKDPAFRLYISHKNVDIFIKLVKMIAEHRSYYSLCMGLSECLANFNFLGMYKAIMKKSKMDKISLNSALPLNDEDEHKLKFDLNSDKRYLKIRLPAMLSTNRQLLKTQDVLIERDGRTIDVELESYFEIPELSKKIMLF